MRRIVIFLLGLAATPVLAAEPWTPHRMVKPDGAVEMEKCSVCHEADLSLSRSKRETCTLCHGETPHSGAAEHLRAEPASVARLLRAAGGKTPALPLSEEGGIYCGTCHLFHDPAVSGEELLPAAQRPASTGGVAAAVQRGRARRFAQIARRHGMSGPAAKFSEKATRALRLPVVDGKLCRHCHGSM